MRRILPLASAMFAFVIGCGDNAPAEDPGIVEGPCQILDPSAPPDFVATIPCKADFNALGDDPIDATLPSAKSVKLVLDQVDSDHLYFQNTQKYQVHYQFCSAHLSGNGLPVVPPLGTFNSSEYFSPDRRFVLAAVTYYELADAWVVELSPYDTASAAMIEKVFLAAKNATYFGKALKFHPTSQALSAVAATLPPSVPVITTDELYAGINFQPLALGTAVGRLHFTTVANLAAGEYLSYQDIAVIDSAPNDIGVVQGTITQEFQTPLSHINILAHNRKTPNMGLRNALTDATLLPFKDKLVKLNVTASGWTVESISQADAEAYWAAHQPTPVVLPPLDLTVRALADIALVTPNPTGAETLKGNILKAIPSYGGKAANYAVLFNTPGLPVRKAFGIPVYYYDKFMRDNGFFARVDAMLADSTFRTDPGTRDAMLAQLRTDMIAAPMDPQFEADLAAKVAAGFADVTKLKFRSSSNSEDLSAFPCAGCYDSFGGLVTDLADMSRAVRQTWASVWSFRGFELRSYYSVDHKSVGMAILAHQAFVGESSNGVAVTANPFDPSGLDPAFYINVQAGEDAEVVSPPPGVSSDQFLYYYSQPNQPISFLAHSNLISAGTTVLSTAQTYQLGMVMDQVHKRFSEVYGPASGNTGWYGMDIEFKFASPDGVAAPTCFIKQARPYPTPFVNQ